MASIWVLSIIGYYGYAAVSLLVVVIRQGTDAVDAAALEHALLFDQLVSLASQHAVAGILIFVAVIGLTILGEVTLASFRQSLIRPSASGQHAPLSEPSSLGKYPDPRVAQIYEWLRQDPQFLMQLVPFLGDQFLSTLKRALAEELHEIDMEHRWQLWLNLGLEVSSLLMSAIPLIAVGVGVGQAVH